MIAVTYADGDRRLMDCPRCGQAARVELHGTRLRVHCYGGCDEADVLGGLDRDAVVDELGGVDGVGPESNGAAPSGQLTQLGNARRLVHHHGRDLRYCHAWRRWLIWDGARWGRDATAEIQRRAKSTVAAIYQEAAIAHDEETRARLGKHAVRSERQTELQAMIDLAASEPGVPVVPAELDADPWLLSCANGTLDLRTGEIGPHDRAALLTRGTDVEYDPDARCPRWLRFLQEVFAGDRELIEFTQRWTGYTLAGGTREHVLAVLHGAGCNGKTTLVETITRVVGEHGVTAAFDTFARARGDRGPRNDLARLHGARMVVASESGEGRRLDEATVKQVTGGDTIAARFLYGEHFEFRPEFKLWLVTNHLPHVDGGDDAIWRRLRLVPFRESFEGREDRSLREALDAELPGILAWAVEGCLDWQANGLGTAEAISQATCSYRTDEDVLGAFLTERCEARGETPAAELRGAFDAYCQELGERPLAASVLGKRLAKRGIASVSTGGRRVYEGVSLS